MEQGNIYNTIRLDQPIEAAANGNVRVQFVKPYVCPSDNLPLTWPAVRRSSLGVPTGTICDIAAANYIGVFGYSEPGVDGEGIFFRNSMVRVADVTDGTSQTLMVGERSFLLGEATWVGAVTGAGLFPPPGSPAPSVVDNASNMVLGHAGDGNGPGAPNSEGNQFYSLHGRGGNFLFADGHIQFLQASMDYQVYRALSSRAGGEPITGDF
jgi:prepilin-type processing-associated H-X9-DG protein